MAGLFASPAPALPPHGERNRSAETLATCAIATAADAQEFTSAESRPASDTRGETIRDRAAQPRAVNCGHCGAALVADPILRARGWHECARCPVCVGAYRLEAA